MLMSSSKIIQMILYIPRMERKKTFQRSPEWKEPFDGNHWHCHLKIDEQKYDRVMTQYDLNCRLNDITQIFI